MKFAVDVTVAGDNIAFDFRRTDPQMPGGMNIPQTSVRSAVQYAVTCLLSQDIPVNEGVMAAISIDAPAGSAVNPIFPAAVSDRHIACERLCDVLAQAMAKIAPELSLLRGARGRPKMAHRLESCEAAIRRARAEFDSYADSILLTEPEAGAVAGVSHHTLKFWRLSGSTKGPEPTYLHGMVRYQAGKLRRWRAEVEEGDDRLSIARAVESGRGNIHLTREPRGGSA